MSKTHWIVVRLVLNVSVSVGSATSKARWSRPTINWPTHTLNKTSFSRLCFRDESMSVSASIMVQLYGCSVSCNPARRSRAESSESTDARKGKKRGGAPKYDCPLLTKIAEDD